MLGEWKGWPKTLIDRQDPDYLDELAAYLAARGDQEEIQQKRREAERRRKERLAARGGK
jgi:hypothetical protein